MLGPLENRTDKGPALWSTLLNGTGAMHEAHRRAGLDPLWGLLLAVCSYKRGFLVSQSSAAEQKRPIEVGGQLLDRCSDSPQNPSQWPDRLGRNRKTKGAAPEAGKSQETWGHSVLGQRAPEASRTWGVLWRPTFLGLTLNCQEEAEAHPVTSG